MAAKITGSVVDISPSGDLITDLTAERLVGIGHSEETKIVVDDEFETFGIYGPEHQQPEMTLIAILEDGQPLRLHLVSDSASMMLGVKKGLPSKSTRTFVVRSYQSTSTPSRLAMRFANDAPECNAPSM